MLHLFVTVLLIYVIVLHISNIANLKLDDVVVVAIVDLTSGFAFGEAQNEYVKKGYPFSVPLLLEVHDLLLKHMEMRLRELDDERALTAVAVGMRGQPLLDLSQNYLLQSQRSRNQTVEISGIDAAHGG